MPDDLSGLALLSDPLGMNEHRGLARLCCVDFALIDASAGLPRGGDPAVDFGANLHRVSLSGKLKLESKGSP